MLHQKATIGCSESFCSKPWPASLWCPFSHKNRDFLLTEVFLMFPFFIDDIYDLSVSFAFLSFLFFSLFFLLICLWWTARLPALRSQRRKEHVRLVVEIVKFRERDDISNKTSFAYSYNDSFMPSTWRTNRLWTLCCNRNIDAKMMLCVLCFCSKRIIFLKCTVDRPFNINCFSVSCFHNSLQQPFRCVIAPHDNENHEQHCNVFERSKGFWHSFVCLFSACGLR